MENTAMLNGETVEEIAERYDRNQRFLAAFIRQGKYDLVAEVATEMAEQARQIAALANAEAN